MERMSCFRFLRSGMERMSCFDSYEKWYGKDVLFSIHMKSGMERMSFLRFIS